MNRMLIIAAACAAFTLCAKADDREGPQDWTAPMTPEVMEQRLRVMGYKNVKKITETESAVRFTVTRQSRSWDVWIDRAPSGANSLAKIDAAEAVEAQLVPPEDQLKWLNSKQYTQLQQSADQFVKDSKLIPSIIDACGDRDRQAEALGDPEVFLKRAGIELPPGLGLQIFAVSPPDYPGPGWNPYFVTLTNCRTVYRWECESEKCKMKKEEICLGIRLIPNPWPPRGPY